MSFNSALILVISFLHSLWAVFVVVPPVLVDVGLGCSFEMFLSFLGRPVSFQTAFAVSHKVWTIMSSFSFVYKNISISSLISFFTHSWFNSMLFNLREFECFGVFFLRFVSSFSPLWSEKMLDIISIFLNLLSLAICPIMWSIFEKVP